MGSPELRILLTMNCVAATWQPFNGRGKEVETSEVRKYNLQYLNSRKQVITDFAL